MNNLFRVLLTVLLLVLLLANIAFFAYNAEFIAYFKLDSALESPEQIIEQAKINNPSPSSHFDLSILTDEKFTQLKDFVIDVSDLELPDNLRIEDQNIGSGEGLAPSFEVGNQNPFSPTF